MILTGNEIANQIRSGGIVCEPFEHEHVNPNSLDLTLGNRLLRYTREPLDPRAEAEVEELEIPRSGVTLPGLTFRLGCSHEIIGSNHFVPIVHGKSSTARAGLFVHVTADLIDIGSVGRITFQLFATMPITVYPGMRIGQVTFWKPHGAIDLYGGKYKGSTGPMKSLSFRDKFWGTL